MSVYHSDILQETHRDQAVKVITHTFCDYEPMTKYLGISSQHFLPFGELMVDKAIKDNLSIVVTDKSKVVACSIVEDIADPLEINIDIDPRFKIIFSLLEHLGEDFFREKHFEKGHLAHLFITAVKENYFGKGLSRKVNLDSVHLAKKRGYDFMCCEFTHYLNEKGTVKHLEHGHTNNRTCLYKDYVYEGKKPFANLDGYASSYVWKLCTDAELRYHLKK
jgi:hypothetical protein